MILPRLRNLLSILAAESEPIPVREVADRLRVSRRTVFRELAGIGSVLDEYDLEIGSRPGEGIVLQGLPQARATLLTVLDKIDASDPADKRERQDRLILEILRAPERKLAAYAERFKVSVPTVSHDLDDIEAWLAGRGLSLSRKAGGGIFIAGGEMSVRRAVLSLMRGASGRGTEAPAAYPHPDILLDIRDMEPELAPFLGWMTPQSRDAFVNYLSVATQRIMDGCALGTAAESAPEETVPEENFRSDAKKLSVILSEAFNIPVLPGETAAIAVELSACRPNVPRPAGSATPADTPALAALAGEMAARFDPALAAHLRMDEALMEGLVNHLRTALVRIRHRVELTDPMLEQLERNYPDVMRKSRAACTALPGAGDWLPESEVSFFAAHFAAALLRISEQSERRKTLRVGIVCVYGIGSSYLLASQVKRIFGSRVLVEVDWHGDAEQWRRHDVLVSTTELPGAEQPVVVVPPILGDDDARRIGEALENARAEPETPGGARGTLAEDLRRMEELAAGARHILERFSVADAPALPEQAWLEELPRMAGRLFGEGAEDAAAIARELSKREAVATQRIPELGITLLHCRTDAVRAPCFGIVRPGCVVMLLPAAAGRELSEMMGSLSAALVERESFLAAVKSGSADAVREGLESILGGFLFQFTVGRLKG